MAVALRAELRGQLGEPGHDCAAHGRGLRMGDHLLEGFDVRRLAKSVSNLVEAPRHA